MKKIYQVFLMTVMALCLAVPVFSTTAEAASIVILPLIDKSECEGATETFYDNAVDCIKDQTKYEMLDNEAVNAAIDKFTVKGTLPDEQALKEIAMAVNADIVMCVQLDTLTKERDFWSKTEELDRVSIFGTSVSYDVETGEFKKQKIYFDEKVDSVPYVRQNMLLRIWSREVRHEMNRVMKVRGMKMQKQRISKF